MKDQPNSQVNSKTDSASAKLPWKSLKLKVVDLVQETQGGGFPGGGNVDDGFYKS